MLRESCTERGKSSVQEAGEDEYGSGKVTYKTGIMWFDGAKSLVQPPRSLHGGWGVSVCLSVCASVYSRKSLRFFMRGAVRTSYCKGSRASGSNRSMWWP